MKYSVVNHFHLGEQTGFCLDKRRRIFLVEGVDLKHRAGFGKESSVVVTEPRESAYNVRWDLKSKVQVT